MTPRSRLETMLSYFVTVHPRELPAVLHAFACFFCLLSAYFVVLPLRDEGAISLGMDSLPGLFVASLVLTLIAAPTSTYVFSLPNLSKSKALFLMHRFFGASLVLFFMMYSALPITASPFFAKASLQWPFLHIIKQEANMSNNNSLRATRWENLGWCYISVRISFFLWVALLNLVTISATWARLIDLMSSESGSRLFGFVGAGATLGQLFGSLLAFAMAPLGPFLLLFSALLMEMAARSSVGIGQDDLQEPPDSSIRRFASSNIDLPQIRGNRRDWNGGLSCSKSGPTVLKENTFLPSIESGGQSHEFHSQTRLGDFGSAHKIAPANMKPKFFVVLDGLRLIWASTYLLHVCCFLWLSAVVSSFFYFQKANIVAMATANSLDRRRMFAEVNSFTAVFILVGQLTVTGRILTNAGVTTAICAAPVLAFANMTMIAISPTWLVVAISETLRKVLTYVLTRPGKEVLFTVVTRDEKYKAKVCIDVLVQRLGDAAAAGIYKILEGLFHKGPSAVAFCALPVCLVWIVAAFTLGRQQAQLAKCQAISA